MLALFGCLAVLGALFALIVLADSLKGGDETHWVAVFVLLAWTTAAVRLYRMDLYVSAEGIRKRGLLRQTTWSWPAIAGFEIKPMAKLKLLGGDAVWIRLANGAWIETTLHHAESLPAVRGMFMAEHELHEIVHQLQGALTRSRNSPRVRNAQ
ncbi:hypothetical protein H4W33_007002 [Kibdelosporangium phytohabitans]|uniref:Low molecular weight protein antigen 6 PH domain-containing protein n=2 Tax=Kibdelosporangium phytohabitans TaxID=860235 RepID=A0A0N9HXG3_9PSEU|nr:PH domain-containing protein [Kibdelosporangium phytohabitans]ALG06758.1 hypothetical protein AOZ06_07300 [Kibdelosporangium phytohabitans]MBE1467990.1 hypothetical protein [Kibdelosporangium phytohabitans]